MPKSLKKRLKGKEAEIVACIRESGLAGAMLLYQVKSHSAFKRWLRANTLDARELNPFSGLASGTKQLWLRQHREFILEHAEVFGRDYTKRILHLKDSTFDVLLSENPDNSPDNLKDQVQNLLKWQERVEILLQIVQGERTDILVEQRELKEAYYNFTSLVSDQLSQGVARIFKQIIEQGFRPDETLPSADGLELRIEPLLKVKNTRRGKEL